MNRVLSLFVSAAALLAIFVPAGAQESGSNAPMSLKTVVIDPGHGGKDAGCISRDKKTYEKNIVLDVSKRLAEKISSAYPDVAVLMTRSNDTFVELENRAVVANKAGADLFISIHVNAVEKGTAANGYSIHCLGQSKIKGNDLYSKNLDLVKRENSVIMLEEGYETKYQGFDPNDPQSSIIFNLMQNAHLGNSLQFAEDVAAAMGSYPIKNSRGVSQDPFWVLWRTAMPSVLIEIGFITNPDDLAILRTEAGREGIAQNIFKAFCTFKSRYDGSVNIVKNEEKKPETKPVTTAPGKVKYGVQVLVTSREMDSKDPFFAGYTPTMIKSGKYYKYVIGVSTSQEEVKKTFAKVQKKFPDAFIIKFSE
ncbi:MAG: N-acetylmuramoyl-L-alanine amidase [Bacteroidales bacterium]|nr:N-acetylmuramoyl-L-alanine amidase [Bacteroidales bacterium]